MIQKNELDFSHHYPNGRRTVYNYDSNNNLIVLIKEFLLNFNNNIYSNFLKNEIIKIANVVLIKFLENSDSFSEKEWNEIYKISEDTFVEETDSSMQKGAGAGLTDND